MDHQSERWRLLRRLENALELPMVALAFYGFTFFGYVTATLASYFINLDAEESRDCAGTAGESERLRRENVALRARCLATG